MLMNMFQTHHLMVCGAVVSDSPLVASHIFFFFFFRIINHSKVTIIRSLWRKDGMGIGVFTRPRRGNMMAFSKFCVDMLVCCVFIIACYCSDCPPSLLPLASHQGDRIILTWETVFPPETNPQEVTSLPLSAPAC